MSTATAISPRTSSKVKEATLQLVPAKPEDFKTIKGYKQGANGANPIIGLRNGMIYWLLSKEKGVFDSAPYIITDTTCMYEFNEYLKQEMVYVPKHPFNH